VPKLAGLGGLAAFAILTPVLFLCYTIS
jgi:hypothetical protein